MPITIYLPYIYCNSKKERNEKILAYNQKVVDQLHYLQSYKISGKNIFQTIVTI
jgi:hypothetical protein